MIIQMSGQHACYLQKQKYNRTQMLKMFGRQPQDNNNSLLKSKW